MSGWYAMQRGWQDNPVFAPEPYTEREAWEWLIGHAAYQDTKRRVGHDVVDLSAGSLAASLRYMMKAWQWKSDKRVRGFLSRLEAEGMIVIGKTDGQKWTRVSICNYSRFQQSGRSEDADGTQTGRKYNKQTNPSSLRSEGTSAKKRKSVKVPMPDDFPQSLLSGKCAEYALNLGMTSETMTNEAHKFCTDHGSKGSTFVNWSLAWQKWCRSWVGYGSQQAVRRDASRSTGGHAPRKHDTSGGMAGAVLRRRSRHQDGDWGTDSDSEIPGRRGPAESYGSGGTVIDARPYIDDRKRIGAAPFTDEAPFGGCRIDGSDVGGVHAVSQEMAGGRSDRGPF